MPEPERLVDDGVIFVQDVTLIKRAMPVKTNVLDQRVRDIMTEDVVSVSSNVPLPDVVRVLVTGGYHSVPVVEEDGKVVGIVTNGDLLRNTSLPIRLGLHPMLTDDQVKSDIMELKAQGRLVGEIMSMPVVTVRDSATVRHAGAMMVDQGLKRLPVVDEGGRLCGIVSRVDILSHLSEAATNKALSEPLATGGTIAELMNPEPPCVLAGASLEEIVQALELSRQQRVVVVDDERRVAGMITDGDILRRSMYGKHPSLRKRLRSVITGQPADLFALPGGRETAKELMTSPAYTIPVGATLSEALAIMLERRLKRLPVVDDDGRLVGLLGRSSILRALMPRNEEAEGGQAEPFSRQS